MRRTTLVLAFAAVLLLARVFPARCGERAVIVIPGIAATELQIEGTTVWPPDFSGPSVRDFADLLTRVARSVDGLNLLSCDGQGASSRKVVPVFMTPRNPPVTGRVGIENFYSPLTKALQDEFGERSVYFFGYDWRMDNEASARELAAFIRRAKAETGAANVDIVAHSMGGFVASAYLARYGDSGNVDRAVFLGTPFLGATDAFLVLAGEDSDWLSFMPERIRTLANRKTTSVYQLLRGMESTIDGIARTCPSVYQLLTKEDRARLPELSREAAGLQKTAQARAGASFAAETDARIRRMLKSARIINVVGSGFPTAAGVIPDFRGGKIHVVRADGDGIVPLRSAVAGETLLSRTAQFPVRHADLVKDRRCIDFIVDRLSCP